ncbi:hypothetical protein BLNAU_4292 [Blattamonas nauphoetae]|uniref:Right handed beta helix domain-containing protein n=1 Tax=Blattamonas nauphoetae TaxID=2049346 RepID=A0ABQ9YA69_9EUKA|nr:hypothetical protein BLNAU_4292 [Blattamonas nauphoetae]
MLLGLLHVLSVVAADELFGYVNRPTALSTILSSKLKNAPSHNMSPLQINLQEGIYAGNNIELCNSELILKGVSKDSSPATEITMTERKWKGKSDRRRPNTIAGSECIFVIVNSTTEMEQVGLVQTSPSSEGGDIRNTNGDSRIAVIDSSDVCLKYCTLCLNWWTSGLVVSSRRKSETERGTSVVINKCAIKTKDGMLRGLTELKGMGRSDIGLSISIVSTLFSNTEMRSSDGVGLAVGREEGEGGSSGEIGISLISNRFQNMSCAERGRPLHQNGLTQRMVGCAVVETSSHVTGSTVRDVHFGGSLLCSNTSFSSILSEGGDAEGNGGTIEHPNRTTEELVAGKTYSFDSSSGDELTSAVFTDCSFVGSDYASLTSPIISFTDFAGSITLTRLSITGFTISTIKDVGTTLGLITVVNSAEEPGFSCTDGTFQTFVGFDESPIFLLDECKHVTFSGCSFSNSVTGNGQINDVFQSGFITTMNDAEKNLFTTHFHFSNCQFRDSIAQGINIYSIIDQGLQDIQYGEIEITLCAFEDCHGRFGGGLGKWFHAPTTVSHCTLVDCDGLAGDDGAFFITSLCSCAISDVHVSFTSNSHTCIAKRITFYQDGSIEHCTSTNCLQGDNIQSVLSFDMNDCHFVDCHGPWGGGGINILSFNGHTHTISKCSFTRCSAEGGSAISLFGTGTVEIIECVIQSCRTTGLGGAITSEHSEGKHMDIVLRTTLFVNNIAEPFPDILFDQLINPPASPYSELSLHSDDDIFSVATFENCFSNDPDPLVGSFKYVIDPDEDLLKLECNTNDIFKPIKPKLTESVKSVRNTETGCALIVLKGILPPIEQDYDVTVKKDETGEEKAMRVRMKDGMTVPNWVSPTETTFLEYSTAYTITKIVGVVPPTTIQSNTIPEPTKLPWEFDLVASASFLSFTTPEAPPIVGASSRIGSGTNHGWIRLIGMSIEAGTFTVTLAEVPDFSFEVTFGSSRDSNGKKESSEASVRLFGDGSKLSFDTEYTLETVRDKFTSHFVDLVGMTIKVRTPESTSRIVEIGSMDFTNEQKDSVWVELNGMEMKEGKYYVGTNPPSGIAGVVLSVVFASQNGRLIGTVYSATDAAVALTFGQTYTIESITNDDEDLVLFVPLMFTVPDRPARIINLSAELNEMKTEVIVEMTGVELEDNAMRMTIKNADTGVELSSNLFSITSTSCLVKFSAGQSESSTQVKFGKTYKIVSIASSVDSSSFVVNTGLSLLVPSAPIVTSISSTFTELHALRDLVDWIGSSVEWDLCWNALSDWLDECVVLV